MNIFYITNVRLPTEKAHGLQIMKMCEAFSNIGLDVTLVVPKRFNSIEGDSFDFYSIKKKFKIVKLPCIDLLNFFSNHFSFSILTFSFYLSSWFYCFKNKADYVYSRDSISGLFFKNAVFEVHSLPKKFGYFRKLIWSRFKCFVVLTSFIKERLLKVLPDAEVLISPDAVDLDEFGSSVSIDFAKKELGFSLNKKIIGYVGALKTMSMEKGISSAIMSLKNLDDNFILCLVGGSETDISFYKKLAKENDLLDKVIFVGVVSHNLVPRYLLAFDCLVAPFPENEHYSYFMSPMKIFEYMASGRPIIASNLPAIREILNDNNAFLVKPSDISELSLAIKKIVNDKELANKISKNALVDINKYTWNMRAKNINIFLKNYLKT